VAEERISEATSRVSSMANDISSKAAGKWDKLESLFEERVAKALGTLGVPTARDIEALMARIDELNAHVAQLTGQAPARKRAAAKPAARPAAKPAAKAPARKRAAAKSAKSTPAA